MHYYLFFECDGGRGGSEARFFSNNFLCKEDMFLAVYDVMWYYENAINIKGFLFFKIWVYRESLTSVARYHAIIVIV